MTKKVTELTYADIVEYGERRASDGYWSMELAITYIEFRRCMPRMFLRRKKDKWVHDNIGKLFNIVNYPDLSIDIVTGEVSLGRRVGE